VPDRDDDDGGTQEPMLGACHGGAYLGPMPTCGGGYHDAEDSERVPSAQYRPTSVSMHDGDDGGDGSDEGSGHQCCGGGQGKKHESGGRHMLWTAQPEPVPATLPLAQPWHPW
jgi:hypothetical protein